MAKEKDKTIVIDKNFPVPPGVVGVSQDDVRSLSESTESGVETGVESAAAGGDEVLSPEASFSQVIAPTPLTSFQVVEQRIRITDDGRAVVDAVVEITGVTDGQYAVDLRVTKL